MLLNQAAVKAAGFKKPIGMEVHFFGHPYHIIGVVGDMLTNSPYEQITPALFILGKPKGTLTLRLAAGLPTHTALARIEAIFKRYNPESPFLYSFNDDDYAKKFDAETRQGNITVVLSTLAIFISCLGLFALASFVAEQRTKEIGVRKVLGAPVAALWALLSRDFLKLTLLSMLIAMPLTAMLMTRWLEHYVYRAPLSWWIFGASGAGILLITLATVSFQSLKAAFANPVHSLRSE
jgi:ABC-type antimicrobial peptide transport system permease subunit